eukprot:CAMPEP_0174239662 /NCGR_PEP_ID=MMETSP0417-20130205/15583_1 /TAXON_ID=242541 /ORGANISM="Mayorella sp, Strain BSH-02190019" /LENGTH=343 /DNA_ID=CAMNT_0015318625 /DNA_START=90 /DNA_END=1121 /DNA_ORIENTATION=-
MVNQDGAGTVPNYPPPSAPAVYQAQYDAAQPQSISTNHSPLVVEESASFDLSASDFGTEKKPLLSKETPSTQWDDDANLETYAADPNSVDYTVVHVVDEHHVHHVVVHRPWWTFSRADEPERNVFIRKVLMLVTAQLILTFGIIFMALGIEPLRMWLATSWWFWFGSLMAWLVLFVVLFVVRRKSPINYVVFFLFTLCMAFSLATICVFYNAPTVIEAMIITVLTTIALVVYTVVTRSDFRVLYGLIVTLLWVMLWWCMWTWVFNPYGFYSWYGYEYDYYPTIWVSVYTLFGIMIFVLFILFDTARIVHSYSEEEWVLAAINLYLDIINLFLCLLQLLGIARR